jgi:hypothetical protein
MAKDKKKVNKGMKKAAPVAVGRRTPKIRIRAPSSAPSFSAAIAAPFSRAADGVRIPDGSPLNSSTVSLVRKFELAASADGSMDCVILPTLTTSAFSSRGSISGGNGLVLADTAVTAGYHGPTTATANGVGFDTEGLGVQYSRFRVAAIGVRVRGVTGYGALGEVNVAVHPLKGLAPASVFIPSLTDPSGSTVGIPSYVGAAGKRHTMEGYLVSMGLPADGTGNNALIDVGKIVNMPCHAVTSVSEIAARGLHIRSVPFEASAREYRSMAWSSIGTDSVDIGSNLSSSQGQSWAVDYGPWKVGGWESIIIGGTGMGDGATPLVVEQIYHLEVVPNPNLDTLSRPTSSVPRVIPTNTLDQQLCKLQRMARVSFSDVVTQVGDALLGDIEGRVAKSAASMGLGSLGGALSRLVVSAM